MIKLVSLKIDPNISFEIKNELEGVRKVLFIWEESKYKTPVFTDIVTLTNGVNAHSGLNKPLSFFEEGITFKIVDLSDYSMLFSHTAYNLSFLPGKKILYVSQNNHTGYGFAARNCIHQLLAQGYEVSWQTDILSENQTQYVPSNEVEQRIDSCRNKVIDYDCVIIHHVPVDYTDLLNRLGVKKTIPVYISTVWETTRIHQSWRDLINRCDQIKGVIVPSSYNIDVFKRSDINRPLHLWKYDTFKSEPLTDKTSLFSKFVLYHNGVYTNNIDLIKDQFEKTVLYNISQYSTRKNVDQIIRTFCKSFNSNDNVCLVLKTFFKTFSEREKEYLKFKIQSLTSIYKNPPSIVLCLEDLNTNEIDTIHQLGDIYFTLNRGEGFGLCSYTAKQFGNRVICGGFGAESEFVDETDYVLPYTLKKPHGMITFHNLYDGDDQLWADYSDDDVVNCLRNIDLKK